MSWWRTTETSLAVWDVFETSWRRTDGTSSLRSHETSSRHISKTPRRPTTDTFSRRSTETLLGVSFETYLRRHWDVQRNVVTTSPRRLVVGWVVSFSLCIKLETQRIVDLLGDADNKSSKIAIWKWYVIND